MANTTGNLSLVEPVGSDTVSELRLAIAANAVALGNADIYATGTISARPAAATGNTGMFYYATDSGDMSLSDGTTWHSLNRGLTTANLSGSAGILGSQLASSAGITLAQLAGGGVLQMTGTAPGTYHAINGQLLDAGASTTIVLPAPTVNSIVWVWCGWNVTAASPVVVTASAGAFYSVGAMDVSSITLGTPGAYVGLVADGVDWVVIAGQQDTGWVPLSTYYTAGTLTYSGTPSYRIIGDRVWFKDAVYPGTGLNIATLPSAARPSVTKYISGGPGAEQVTIATSGLMTAYGLGTALLEGESFSLS